jgi:hypothetical protein
MKNYLELIENNIYTILEPLTYYEAMQILDQLKNQIIEESIIERIENKP